MKTIYYTTSYCNNRHQLDDGIPINHECYVLPSEMLRLEREDKIAEAQEVLRRTLLKPHKGKRVK
jgi:hypothetical protein